MSSDTPTAPFVPRKIAIPRMPRPTHAQHTTKDRRRVPRACTACRNHKIKCTGNTPSCKHCEATNRECVYILPRKDRLKIMTERCVQMAGLLAALRGRADDVENARIGELLEAVEEDISEARQTYGPSILDTDADRAKEFGGMISASPVDRREHERIDTSSLDLLDEDLLKDDLARATGFVGKSSELQWLRSIMRQPEKDDESSTTSSRRRSSSYRVENIEQVSAFNFYLNSEGVDLDFVIDPYELPTPEIAERLLKSYMLTVHDSFPILPRKQFEEEFRNFFKALRNNTAPRLSPKWQAIMNLVFAIGAKHSHLTKARWRADEGDHVIYQSRARVFGMNEFALTSHPDVPQIQVAGLLAFYYLSVGQISRAWVIVGVALRFAYSLGLHVRNEDPSASSAKKEMLVRIWWSLYYLERLLSIITGRPSTIVDSTCSVPLPAPISDEQLSEYTEEPNLLRRPQEHLASPSSASASIVFPTFLDFYGSDIMDRSRTSIGMEAVAANCGSYFKSLVQLGIITQNVLSSLYSAAVMLRPLGEVQQDIVQLSHRLDNWVLSLPIEFNFQAHNPRLGSSHPSQDFCRERLLLAFQFCSARILLTRPCLYSINQPTTDPSVPMSFIRRMADICIDAAKMATDFLPDQPDPLSIYETGPWWSVVHNIMQAVSVFLLGLSYCRPGSQEIVVLSQYAKKLVRWLRMMKDPLAERGYQMSLTILEAVAGRLALDMSDLWMEDAMVFPNPDLRGTQAVPYGTGNGGLPDDAHAAASMFTSFDPLPATNFQQQNNDPTFHSPFFHNV